jgi:putative two-component system response regulator
MPVMSHSPDRLPVTVLVVDDERAIRAVVTAALGQHAGVRVVGEGCNGLDAVRLSRELRPDVVVMDVHMPKMDGSEACDQIVRDRPDARVVALTGHVTPEDVTRMILAGAVGYAVKGADPDILCQIVLNAASARRFIDDAAVPDLFDSVVQLAREERDRREEAERLAGELQQSYQETVRALVQALRSRDTATEEHGDRVAERVVAVGRRLGLTEEQLADLEYGAVFHDIGKIGVPDSILHNEDELTDDEWQVIRQHTVVGEQIIRPVGFLRNVAGIVRHSHEHWDGSGYPDGLAGEEIPIESRVIFACDAFDAMTSKRSYQEPLDHGAAIARMRELAGVRFDPRVVDAVLEVLAGEQDRAGAAAKA